MRDTRAAVLVAALLLTAGCLSGVSPFQSSSSAEQPTATASSPSPSDGEPTVTGSSSAESMSVPGVTSDGVDTARLIAAHNESLWGRAYTLSLVTVRGGAERQLLLQRERRGVPSLLYINRSNRTSTQRSTEYFADQVYQRFVDNGSVSYNTAIYTRPPPYTGQSILRNEMRQATYTPTGTTTRNGTELLVLTAEKTDLRPGAFGNATVDRFSARALVDGNGTIRAYRLVATGEIDGGPFLWRTEFRVTGVGTTTVPKPDWIPRAQNATTADN